VVVVVMAAAGAVVGSRRCRPWRVRCGYVVVVHGDVNK